MMELGIITTLIEFFNNLCDIARVVKNWCYENLGFKRWHLGGVAMSDEKREKQRQQQARHKADNIQSEIRDEIESLMKSGYTISHFIEVLYRLKFQLIGLNVPYTSNLERSLVRMMEISHKTLQVSRRDPYTGTYTEDLMKECRVILHSELNTSGCTVIV